MQMHRSASHKWTFVLGLVAVLAPAVAQASILGHWTLQMNVTLRGEEAPCVFEGTANLSAAGPNSGFDFSGPVHLDLVSGPQSCASSLDGVGSVSVTLSAQGLLVNGQIDGGRALGFASFTGLVAGDPTASGTFSVTGGPFAGLGGTWSGSLAASVVSIPALGAMGLVLLAGLLAVASLLTLRRRASGVGPAGIPTSNR
jgi:hypothetical protein